MKVCTCLEVCFVLHVSKLLICWCRKPRKQRHLWMERLPWEGRLL